MGTGTGAGDGEGDKEPTIQELSEQISNLNKGIAGYRDTATKAEQRATAAEKLAADAKAEVDALKLKDDGKDKDKEPDKVQLNPADQKKLEQWAKEQGFVTKSEMDAEKNRMFNDNIKGIETQAIDEFIKKHPEYEDSDKWEKVKAEFGQYKQPTSITAYRKILDKIHGELAQEGDAEDKKRADTERRKLLGLGGGTQKTDDTDSQLEALQKRYPNLSLEQIESRLAEINQLADARAKRNAKRGKK